MDKFYVGYDEEGNAETFCASNPKYATPEATGFQSVEGPFDTKEEAQEQADKANGE